ncbi:BadF-type ATPase [Nocardioides terrae]|uniref:BadF-type ATPase n=1 Tax=Nocardioides terrae TaxID=574651 RepID=A0A1I1MI53_9ACTN|nr:BadF-type ATPase [Nocardioides terrae]
MVVDHTGRCLGLARSGGGNPISSGPDQAAAALAGSAGAALSAAGISPAAVEVVLLAVAGAGSPTHRGALTQRLAGLTDRPVFASDLLATFCSGTHRPDGYALIGGTGAAAIRVERGRQSAVADGLGWLLGDEGSGFSIGHRVARAALADLDGRGPATTLTGALRARLSVPAELAAREAAEAITRSLYAALPVRLADLAALAFDAAGDPVADGIVADAAQDLATTLRAVTSSDVAGPVVVGGGVLSNSVALREAALAAYAGQGPAPEAVVVRDGTVGTAVLALRHAGATVDEQVFRTLTTSIAAEPEPAPPAEPR